MKNRIKFFISNLEIFISNLEIFISNLEIFISNLEITYLVFDLVIFYFLSATKKTFLPLNAIQIIQSE